ncbi:MAG: hypothetical protein PHD07_05100 [Bacteroidales bacterium]|nr:hypothetical protein [Bacteroidales bacterium]MDD3201431.1 hypothetical protein [Bacteroidales bacterium]
MSSNTIAQKAQITNTSVFSRLFSADKSKRRVKEIYFNPTNKAKIAAILEKQDFNALSKMEKSEHGSLLKITFTRDRSYVAFQLFDYVPYQYVKSSPMYEFTDNNAEHIYALLTGALL